MVYTILHYWSYFEIIMETVHVVYIILHCWSLTLTLCEISLLSIGTNSKDGNGAFSGRGLVPPSPSPFKKTVPVPI